MTDVHFFPLVDMTDDGSVKFPMFMAKDEQTLKSRGKPYFVEFVPRTYRLRGAADLSEETDFRCPYCGRHLTRINIHSNINNALFVCENCK